MCLPMTEATPPTAGLLVSDDPPLPASAAVEPNPNE
jgi:hypothetical protein